MCIRAVGAQVREQEAPSANLVPGNIAITPQRGSSNLIFLKSPRIKFNVFIQHLLSFHPHCTPNSFLSFFSRLFSVNHVQKTQRGRNTV